MHRTISLDYGHVLEGELVLEIDDGIEVTIRRGDTVVQKGTIHAWHNRSKEIIRMRFVLIASERILINGC